MIKITHFASAFILILVLSGCSMAKLTVRASMPMIEGGMTALNKETDLEIARAAIPANIELLEGMIINAPDNQRLREYAAQAYYGYAYGFIEDNDKPRASRIYLRGLKHGKQALLISGLDEADFDKPLDDFHNKISQLNEDALGALFWTASCWAKWIDMNRDQTHVIAQLPKAVALMEQVLKIDDTYFMSGAHVFFGVYHGSRSPMMGGNFEKSEYHFNTARKNNNDKLLLVDLLQAQYLEYQRFDRAAFHKRLTAIKKAPEDLFPEQALINTISKQKAALFLEKEEQWF